MKKTQYVTFTLNTADSVAKNFGTSRVRGLVKDSNEQWVLDTPTAKWLNYRASWSTSS